MKTRLSAFAAISLMAAFGLTACNEETAAQKTASVEAPKAAPAVAKVEQKKEAPAPVAAAEVKEEKKTPIVPVDEKLPNGVVVIGNQVWASQNLNVSKNAEGKTIGHCYNNNEANCESFGRLYTWAEAMGIDAKYNETTVAGNVQMGESYQGICPTGFHIPTANEWEELGKYINSTERAALVRKHLAYAENEDISGILLRGNSTTKGSVEVWAASAGTVPGEDTFAFNLVGAGAAAPSTDCNFVTEDNARRLNCKTSYNADSYSDLRETTFFWTNSETRGQNNEASIVEFSSSWTSLGSGEEYWYWKKALGSVRCIMNMSSAEYAMTDEYSQAVAMK